MTVTLNSGWETVEPSELQPGRRVGRGFRDDLRALGRAITHEFASDGATALAVLSAQRGIPKTGTSYTAVGYCKVGIWGNGARLNFHMYGHQTRLRLTVGGVVVGSVAVTSATPAWVSLGGTTLAGATADADGLYTVMIEQQATTASPSGVPEFLYCIVSEEKVQAADLPAFGNTQTSFYALHDEALATADDPVDVWQMQALDDLVEQAMFERTRRSATMYPITTIDQMTRLSSAHWRLDGPYVIEVPPHYQGDGLTVTVTLELLSSPALDLYAFALTEFEDFGEARIERTQAISTAATVTHLTFKGLRARAGQPCMVWVAFRSEVASGTTTTPDCYSWSALTPGVLWCERDGTLEGASGSPGGVPWGYCIEQEAQAVAADKDPTIKAALGYTVPTQLMDIACVQGLDNSTGGTTSAALMLTISPHPGTGLVSAPEFGAVLQTWTGDTTNVSFQPALQVKRCAIAYLYGVYIQCGPTAAPARNRAHSYDVPPSAGWIESIVNRVNAMVFNGNSQCIIRHPGQRLTKPGSTLGGSQEISYGGSYLFVESASTAGDRYPVAVPLATPNVSGGLGSLTLRARFIFAAVVNGGNGFPNETEALYRCRFTSGDWVTGIVPLEKRPTAGSLQSPTQADLLAAGQSTSNEVGASPLQATANAYGQQYTWPTEGNHKNMRWTMGEVFLDDSSPSFPTVLIAEIQPIGGATNGASVQLIIAGLSVWWAPRES